MQKQDFALNNKYLICHKTKPNQSKHDKERETEINEQMNLTIVASSLYIYKSINIKQE